MEADPAIDPRAARGFRDVADAYERGRPGYPRDAVADVLADLDVHPPATTLDLAAGTGKLTRVLVELGYEVVAVEPLEGMRSMLRRIVPAAEVVDGTAEAIPLGDATVDAVLVAQAFHWFRVPDALAEIERVLRPRGGLVLLWNLPRGDDAPEPWEADVDAALERHGLGKDNPGRTFSAAGGAWRLPLAESGAFEPIRDRVVPNTQRLAADDLVALLSSWSWIAGLADEPRAAALADVREALAANGVHGSRLATVRHRLEISWTRRVR